MSTYDDIHDIYFAGYTAGDGKRYERLTALVMKILDNRQDVIHDLQLRGISDVKHQIDVIVARDGARKRVIIECKDYDRSGEKVGLPEMRNFESACRDLGAEEAYFITCNDFTKPAQKYARHYNIKLLVLRKFRDADWANRMHEIRIEMNIDFPQITQIQWFVGSPDDIEVANRACAEKGISLNHLMQYDQAVLMVSGITQTFHQFINALLRESDLGEGEHCLRKRLEETSIYIEGYPAIGIAGVEITYTIVRSRQNLVMTGTRIAEFLLCGYQEDDLIVYEDDLQRFSIDGDTGQVMQVRESHPGILPVACRWS